MRMLRFQCHIRLDGISFDAVVYTSVYEDEGKLYAMFEMADYPVEMEELKSSPPTYRITYKSTGDFNLVFSDMENGRFNTLTMTSNGWDPVRLHRTQSVTKSYTSTLVGLALKRCCFSSNSYRPSRARKIQDDIKRSFKTRSTSR